MTNFSLKHEAHCLLAKIAVKVSLAIRMRPPTVQTPEIQAHAEQVIKDRAADLERARRWMRTRMPGRVEGFIDRGPMQVDAMLAAYAREEVIAHSTASGDPDEGT